MTDKILVTIETTDGIQWLESKLFTLQEARGRIAKIIKDGYYIESSGTYTFPIHSILRFRVEQADHESR